MAIGDVNGDDEPDIVTGVGPGAASHVKVFDGGTGAELRSFFAFAPGFNGGVFVAAGDVSGDGKDDIIVGADAGGAPHVKVFRTSGSRNPMTVCVGSPVFGREEKVEHILNSSHSTSSLIKSSVFGGSRRRYEL